jgi:glyoxylase-like metal-dependent hydrolase (beta-lactamase superfamily II)
MASGGTDPAVSVHWYDEDTVLLRQGKSVHFEAPFLALLLGEDRALLLDTGAVADADRSRIRSTVDHLIDVRLDRDPDRTDRPYPLVVAHTHPHADHVAGDAQFADRPDTVIVGHGLEAVQAFFGLEGPGSSAVLDLGGRSLEVIAAPGHHAAAIAVIDSGTGWLLSGDTVYPGRLYIEDDVAFAATLDVLLELARRRRVTAVVGCHVEMTTRPGVDHPEGTIEQPDEPVLPMTLDQLAAVRAAAHEAIGRPGRHVHDDFVLVNRTP